MRETSAGKWARVRAEVGRLDTASPVELDEEGPAGRAKGRRFLRLDEGAALPDLDSDSGVPVRELFGVAAATVPFLLLQRLDALILVVQLPLPGEVQ